MSEDDEDELLLEVLLVEEDVFLVTDQYRTIGKESSSEAYDVVVEVVDVFGALDDVDGGRHWK